MSTFIETRATELGLDLEDATESAVLNLTLQDIKQAKVKNFRFCAFARAAKRQYGCKQAYFFRQTAWFEYKDKMVRYRLPGTVQREIVAFDRDGGMMPGEYKISPVNPSMRLGKVRPAPKRQRTRSKSKVGESRAIPKISKHTEAIRTLDGLWYVPTKKKTKKG